MVASLWVLSVLDSTGKWLQAAGIGLPIVLFFRYAVHATLLTIWASHQRREIHWFSGSIKLQVFRSVVMVASSALFFKTLSLLPLAEATSINFLAPLITLVLAPMILGEQGRPYRWFAVAIAWMGAMLVIRPFGLDQWLNLQSSSPLSAGSSLDLTGALFAVATALTFSVYQLMTRKLAGVSPIVTNLWSGWIGTLICGITLWTMIASSADLHQGKFSLSSFMGNLDQLELLLLFATGVIGLLGHLLQVQAYRLAPANVLTPYVYFQIIAALALGAAIFGQWPDLISLVGMSIICVTGVVVALIESRRTNLPN